MKVSKKRASGARQGGADGADGADNADRVVVIDPSGRGVPALPPGLAARPPHQWGFTPIPR